MTEPKVCFCEFGTFLCWASQDGVVKVGRLDVGAKNEWARAGGDVGLTKNRASIAIECRGGRVCVDFEGPDGLPTTSSYVYGSWVPIEAEPQMVERSETIEAAPAANPEPAQNVCMQSF